MRRIFSKLLYEIEEERNTMLVTVIADRGSAPRGAGAAMLVGEKGRITGTIGGGGLGQIAITYGYQKYDDQIVWLCVALTIIIVQILQEFGMYIARRTDRRART